MVAVRRPPRLLLVVAGALASLGLAACALDFDRFDPVSADAAPRPDAGPADGAGLVGADDATPDADDDVAVLEATIPDAGETGAGDNGDARAGDAGPSADASDAGACTASPTCIASAHTCGTNCAQTEQQCASRCSTNNCRTNCTRTENSCVTQCSDTCATCTLSAGCSATAACATAAKP